MKKIGVLSGCLMALLLLCLVDVRVQKKNGYRQAWNEGTVTDEQPDTGGTMGEAEDITEIQTQEQEDGQSTEDIRVLLKTGNFESEYHESITVSSANGFLLKTDETKTMYEGNRQLELAMDSPEFEEGQTLRLTSEDGWFILPALVRSQEAPSYEGDLEIRRTDEGLLVINVLPLEQYLCGVVPSEMPASYPEEALKAQAVCARTYARKQMQEGRAQKFYADVDDSVSYQVYNNQAHAESTDQAVKETAGMVLLKDGELQDALYYSTSCGLNTSLNLSDETVFAAFLSDDNRKAYEAEEPWYRWHTEVLLENFDQVEEISVKSRSQSGRVEELEVTKTINGREEAEVISGEYSVRKFLNEANPVVILQDGSTAADLGLLPSAFFIMTPLYDGDLLTGYRLDGGGYGHGNGMSQNGAKCMALEGLGYEEILENYYGQGVRLAESADL